MTLEHWLGGRWFRDRGNGAGHLWGHVQVIKPPVLLELSGPMFMSYPEIAGGTRLALRHRSMDLLRHGPRTTTEIVEHSAPDALRDHEAHRRAA